GARRINVMVRCAMYAKRRRWFILQRIFIIWIERAFGVYISTGAEIGPGVRFAHPTGVVIGSGAVVGRNVTIYQQVTIGALGNEPAAYPRVCDGATIYAG